MTYSVPQLHSYSKYDRLGETVDRLGFAMNTNASRMMGVRVQVETLELQNLLVQGAQTMFSAEVLSACLSLDEMRHEQRLKHASLLEHSASCPLLLVFAVARFWARL